MRTLDDLDDALLALSAKASGRVRDTTGIDQWTQARMLMRVFIATTCLGYGIDYVENGFKAMSILVVAAWTWAYAVIMKGIDRNAAVRDGSARLRIGERQYRRLYAPMLLGIALVTAARQETMQVMVAIGFTALVIASYVKACEPPPPAPRGSCLALA